VEQGKIYFPTLNEEIHVLDAASGKLLRKVADVKGLATELVVAGDLLVYGETEGQLVLREKSNLRIVDRFAPGLGIFARPTVNDTGEQIYLMSNDANLYRLDLKRKPENSFLWSSQHVAH
jgi:outer membrane protein assembly factor BamB